MFVKSRTHGAFSAARVLCCSTQCWRQLCRNGGRPAPWWNMHDVAEGSPAPAAGLFHEDGPGNKGLVSSLPAARPPTGGRANGPALEGRTADSGRDQHPSYQLPRAEKEPPVGSLRRVDVSWNRERWVCLAIRRRAWPSSGCENSNFLKLSELQPLHG